MASVNLGSIKFNWKGPYNSGTSYAVDDVVSHSGSSYVCILASTGNVPTNTTYWEQMSSAGTDGTDGTDLTTTLTTEGDMLYRDGSGLQRLPKGTANQTLQMNGGATAPTWVTASGGGTYTFHAYDSYNYQTNVGGTTSQDYLDIAGGNTVTFTPTSTDDLILFMHGTTIYTGYTTAGDVYMNLGTSSTLGSGDTKLNYDGRSTYGTNAGSAVWFRANKSFVLPCTSLTVGTQYYAEQAAATYSTGNWWYINYEHTNASGNHRLHNVEMFHYKKS
tara:strand:- start:2644 stop:3468 length:825 start_codon:yes stop_codon:yes gene_type:complete